MCERRSRVTGSTVWYSSSIPIVKVGRIVSRLAEHQYNNSEPE
jgi:hypothetical protein